MPEQSFIALNIAVLTVSDSRNQDDDVSGRKLEQKIKEAGHHCVERCIVADNLYQIRSRLSAWIADAALDVIITTGGTGVTGRDSTPEAAVVLFDKTIDGFGEIFRALSYEKIGTSSIQSRALSGVANGTYIFCLPGSPGACADAWNNIIVKQLDKRTRPCNLVELIPRLKEKNE